MHVLVTGGAGFIGSSLVRALLERGDQVRILDNFSTGSRTNLDGVKHPGQLEVIAGDIRDAAVLRESLRGIEIAFHEAAIASVPQSLLDPVENDRVNAGGTAELLHLARQAGVGRVVYAASAAVYGDTAELPLRESMPPAPLSPYGVSKYAGELYLRAFHRSYGMETVALRYFNVFGPRQDPRSPYSGVLSRFIAAYASGQTPVIFGDGQQTRDFVFVQDVVQANLRAADAPADRVAGGAFNVGTGQATSLLQMIAILRNLFPGAPEPRFEAERAGDVRHSRADIRKISEALGYRAEVSLEEGLRQTVEWFISTSAAANDAAVPR